MSTGRQRANTEETDFTEKMFREELRRYRLQQQPDSDVLYVHICYVRFTNENYVTIQQPPVCQSPQALLYASPTSYHPGGGKTICPRADGSSTRGGSTSVRGPVRGPHTAKLQAANVPIA